VTAAVRTAAALGLAADDAVVLQNSNQLTLRLRPCDTVARVVPGGPQVAPFEVDLAQRLVAAGCPVGALEPRVPPGVYERDGFTVTLWAYYEPVGPPPIPVTDYVEALEQLYAGMRSVDVPAPHWTDRVAEAQDLVADRDRTPELPEAERDLLARTLDGRQRAISERGRPEQLLHGEPHPGNVLITAGGLRFIDLETCCRGPIEFDLAYAPDEVADRYPGADPEVLRDSRILMLAMITMWRWDRDDQLPDGRRLAAEWTARMRSLLSQGRK
jgi:hypothetical protein